MHPPPPSAAGRGIPPAPRRGPYAWLPGLWVLRHYQRHWLPRDVGAGLALTALLVPAGMGYAEASGLPPVHGLYATVAPLLAYAVFGPSRILVLGPDSALVSLVAAAVLAGGGGADSARAVAVAAALAVATGLLCALAGVLRLGFVTDLLSKPVRTGYLNGIALTILVSQAPKLLGFDVHEGGVPAAALAVGRGLLAGRSNLVTLTIGAGCLALVLALRRLAPRVPGVLVAVVLATVVVAAFALDDRVAVVGAVPRGLPTPSLPRIGLGDLRAIGVAAAGIALVSFADASVLSRTFAGRTGYRVDPNRELVALGAANLAAGLCAGFPVSTSASRTPVAEAAGSRTQVTGVVGALAVVLLLQVAPTLLAHLPVAALAAVVTAAAIGMVDVATLRASWRVRRSDFVLALVAFAAVALLGVLDGIGVAVAVSLLDVVRRAWRPHAAVLGRAAGVKGYHDVTRYPAARRVPGLLLFRWDAPLFFANADVFRARIVEEVDAAYERGERLRWVVVAAEPVTDVDTTAAEMLEELDVELAARDVELAFAELKDPVKDRIVRYGLDRRLGDAWFFPTLGVAVKTYLSAHEVPWTDWEDDGDDRG